jgi:hypothetical protein
MNGDATRVSSIKPTGRSDCIEGRDAGANRYVS